MFGKKQNITRYTTLVVSVLIMCNVFQVNGYYEKQHGTIYILVWTFALDAPFDIVEWGDNAFKNCTYKNCFFTSDHGYLSNEIEFEAILFNILHLKYVIPLPMNRSIRQIYIMCALEPAMFHYLPPAYNGFFNISFTYKLSSTVPIPYMFIKDANKTIIGPKIDMHWMKLSDMNEISDYVIEKLKNKRIAAVWIVSNCWPLWRTVYINDLKKELARYNHSIDVYGDCGARICPTPKRDECNPLIESDYYFYLSFENSFGEDYVSEKILNGLDHYAVPVVYGGADYSRFMPDGIYLNAGDMEPYKLAKRMSDIIADKNEYYQFFKWHDHYTYHFTGSKKDRDHEAICNLCAYLNVNGSQTSILNNIAEWWNEEQPLWPLTTTATQSDQEPNVLERSLTKLIEFFDPPSDE